MWPGKVLDSARYLGISVSWWCFSFSLPDSWQFDSEDWIPPPSLTIQTDPVCMHCYRGYRGKRVQKDVACRLGKLSLMSSWQGRFHVAGNTVLIVHTGEQPRFSLIWNSTQCISCKTISNPKNSIWVYRLLLGSGRRRSLLTFLFPEMRD